MKIVRSLFCTLLTPLLFGALAPAIHAQTTGSVTTVYDFTSADGSSGLSAGPVQGDDGNFYGTSFGGGTNSYGSVYRITPGSGLTTLYSFAYNGSTGSYPIGGLVKGSDGNFYGTTEVGGASYGGTVFQITPDGTLTTLHSFSGSGSDGNFPFAGVSLGSDGNFYGTTYSGGTGGYGTIFRITPGGALTTLYSFTGGSDGKSPQSSVLLATDGSIYGTAATAASSSTGILFRLAPGGALTTVFTYPGTSYGSAYFQSPLIQGSDGNLYGTTSAGGDNGEGSIFQITPDGALTTLYSFTGGSDNSDPLGTLFQSTDGSIYGTANGGNSNSTNGSSSTGSVFRFTPGSAPMTLHYFGGDGINGNYPETGVIQGSDGNFYGTTYSGGANGYGTFFKLDPNAVYGVLQFASATFNVSENAGSATVSVSRAGESAGAVSVVVTTSDGSALDGTDYTATATTLSWADGDSTDKSFTVPILDNGLADGSTRTFIVTLSAPTGGATLGTMAASTVSILENDVAPTPTITITSPPNDITVVTGTPLTLSASVVDPGGIATQAQFFLNGQPYSQASANKAPFNLAAVAPLPGTYVLTAKLIDNRGDQIPVSTRTVTVLAPSTDPNNPAPATSLVTALNGRMLAGADTLTLTATADSLSPDGTPLAEVDFYADNTLIAAYDGNGNPLSGSATTGGMTKTKRRTAAAPGDPARNGTLFTAPWNIPNLTKLVNLLTVAKNQSGVSQVSTPLTVQTMATSATSNHAPSAKLQGVSSGQKVRPGTTLNIPVAVSDPDASNGTTSVAPAANTRRLSDATSLPGSVISKVDYYLNQLQVASTATPPYSFSVTPPAEGTYVLEAIVTDGAGLSGVADPVIIQVTAPTVALTISGVEAGTVSTTVAGGGPKLKLFVTRTGDDLSTDVTVNYKAVGDAVAGVNYNPLAGTVTIPAGSARAKIKVATLDDGVADGSTQLKIKLKAATDGSYDLGTPTKAKITILDVEGQ